MAYSNFTLESVRETFHLEQVNAPGIFAGIKPVEPSAHLKATLERNVPFAYAIGTEKARSEMIIADVLIELCIHMDYRVSLFSGIDFNVDDEADLTGVCDFVLSLSPRQFALEAPVIILVTAKNADVKQGLGQCAAEMVAAQRFNAQRGNDIPCIYGSITSGIDWLFLKLEGAKLQMDMAAYTIERCDKILGILASMAAQKA